MIPFGEHEQPRSMQLYDVDPATIAEAIHPIESILGEDRADHIDMNAGSPMSVHRHTTSHAGVFSGRSASPAVALQRASRSALLPT